MPPEFDLSKVIAALERSPLVGSVDVLLADEIPHHFHHKSKVRSSALSGNALWDIRLVLSEVIEIIAR